MRQAFAELDADVYVLADGDGTYDATRAPQLVRLVWEEKLDMVVGTRQPSGEAAFRHGHTAGNYAFNWVVQVLFGSAFTDIFSGYRAFSRPFVKSFPALATGFETETEMSLHAIQLGLPCRDISTSYKARSEGSVSKLRTYRDGIRILWFIVQLMRHTKPFLLFGLIGFALMALSLGLGLPVITEFLRTGLVPRYPTAIAAASLMVIAMLNFTTGIVLDSMAFAQRESKRLSYLSVHRSAPIQAIYQNQPHYTDALQSTQLCTICNTHLNSIDWPRAAVGRLSHDNSR
jgi:hypothetical protein